MTVFEYFDYEKRLLEDFQAVKTPRARAVLFNEICSTLDEHKQFVIDTMHGFEERVEQGAKHIMQVYNGETPDYVKQLMAEFGFHELEQCNDLDLCGNYGGKIAKSGRNDARGKIKSSRKTDTDVSESAESPSITDGVNEKECNQDNAKALPQAGSDAENSGKDPVRVNGGDFLNADKPAGKLKKNNKAAGRKKRGVKAQAGAGINAVGAKNAVQRTEV